MSQGAILLFHFDPQFQHAKHCWDWCPAAEINGRIHGHYNRTTKGPKLIHKALDAGSKLKLARIIPGTKDSMLVLRSGGNAVRLCPICKKEAKLKWQDEHMGELLAKSLEHVSSASNG